MVSQDNLKMLNEELLYKVFEDAAAEMWCADPKTEGTATVEEALTMEDESLEVAQETALQKGATTTKKAKPKYAETGAKPSTAANFQGGSAKGGAVISAQTVRKRTAGKNKRNKGGGCTLL